MLVLDSYHYLATDVDGNQLYDRDGFPLVIEGERWIEVFGVVSPEQALAGEALADEIEAQAQAVQATRDRIAELEQLGLAAFMDGDSLRLEQLRAEREKLKAQLP